MLKLIFFLLGALAVPAVTWWMESRDPVKADVRRMADRDRQAQAVRLPQRRMQYAQIVKPALLQQHGRPARG
jgi:hypothetical protein